MDRWRVLLDGEPVYYTKDEEGDPIRFDKMLEVYQNQFEQQPHCLVFVLGRSGSGKDTIVDLACELGGYRKVRSYTTRPPRENEGNTHIFITEDQYDDLEPAMIAKTTYDGYRYGTTKEMLDECDFYIIDVDGYASMDFDALTYPYMTVLIQADPNTCYQRMLNRGDTLEQIERRMHRNTTNVLPPTNIDFRLSNSDNRDPVECALELINILNIAIHTRMQTLVQLHDCVESIAY